MILHTGYVWDSTYYLPKVQCAARPSSSLIGVKSTVTVAATTGLSALTDCVFVWYLCCYCWRLLCGLWPQVLPLSLHTPFCSCLSQSFHKPSASSPSGEWSLRPNWTGELLLAESEISLRLASERPSWGGEERIGVSGGRSVQSAFYEPKISRWKVTEMRQWHR